VRHLVIVARDRPDLLDSLKHRFAADRGVDVLVDRRTGLDRPDPPVDIGDRRQSPEDVEARLWVEGYVIVRLA
jgi:hypothetical protein